MFENVRFTIPSKHLLKMSAGTRVSKTTQGGPEIGGPEILRNSNPISGPPKSGKGTLHVGQFSARQLEGGPECGRPEETNKKTIKNSGYMREHSTQNYPNISKIWIYFGSVKITLKSNLTLFSPQVCRRKQTNSGHGAADHAGGGTPAGRTHGSLPDDCDGCGSALYNPYRY